MQQLQKELIFNLILVSPLLASGVAAVGAIEDARSSARMPGSDAFIAFMLFCLILLAFHALTSVLHYGIGRLLHRQTVRLLVFNGIGAAMATYFALLTKETLVIWLTLPSFIVYSAVTLLVRAVGNRSAAAAGNPSGT